MFEKFFGDRKKNPEKDTENKTPSPNPIKPVEFDGLDREANRVAIQIERDAMRVNQIAIFLDNKINEIINVHQISEHLTLDEFIYVLEDDNANYSDFMNIKQQLEHFILMFPNDIKRENTLREFIEILRNKIFESDQILHPRNQ